MQNFFLALLVCSVLVFGMVENSPGDDVAKNPAVAKPESVKPTPVKKVYRHVVLFKFKEDATKEQVQAIVAAFGNLKNEIDTVLNYEYGTDVSPEKLAKGFSHCFLVTFANKKDLEAYLPHKAHQAFTAKLKPILADVLVVDYWTES